MKTYTFERRTRLPVSAADAFDWHARPGALPRLVPPWETIEVVDPGPGLHDGARATIRTRVAILRVQTWVAEHRDVVPGRQFRDVQLQGPFKHWDHLHSFEADGDDACELVDHVEYALPVAGSGGFVRRTLDRTFRWRHATTAADLAAWRENRAAPRRRVLVTGATGLVGRTLLPFLTTQGHEAVRLVRSNPRPGDATWDPQAGTIDLSGAGAIDAVVHLAGENVASGRWSSKRKARIRDSRVAGTQLLAHALADLEPKPRTLVMASGTGFYGDRGDQRLDESADAGDGFLADLARDWEAAADPARHAGLHVVPLRLGVVLTPAGGALPRLLGPAKLGLGGRLGSGRQYLPWIGIDDLLDVVLRALNDERLDGPVNTVAPEAVTNRDFAQTLGRVLRRPAFVPAPAFALRLLMGEAADEMLLASQRVVPGRLDAIGHGFRHPTLEDALRHVLGRPRPNA